jgi:hypothetical protein
MKFRSDVEAVDVEVYDLVRVGAGKKKVTAFVEGLLGKPRALGTFSLLVLVLVLIFFRARDNDAAGGAAFRLPETLAGRLSRGGFLRNNSSSLRLT